MLGPVDYVAIGFKGNKFNGEIVRELNKVVEDKLIRVIDLLFVMKDVNGDVAVIELENMPEDVKIAFSAEKDDIEGLLSEEDALQIANDLEANSSAGILVFEHLWAKGFKQAVINANGILLAEGRIHPEDVEAVLEEVSQSK